MTFFEFDTDLVLTLKNQKKRDILNTSINRGGQSTMGYIMACQVINFSGVLNYLVNFNFLNTLYLSDQCKHARKETL